MARSARSAFRTGLLVLLIALLAAGGQASAHDTTDLTDLRRQLGDTVAELDATRDVIAVLRGLVAEERVYMMQPFLQPDDESSAWGFVTREEGIAILTLHYLLRIERHDIPFSQQELARLLSFYLRATPGIITDYLDELERRAERLTRQRNTLENLIAEHDPLPPTGRCIFLVDITRRSSEGGTMAADAYLSGATSIIHAHATAAETRVGQPARFDLSWSSPPQRICIGEPFRITVEVANLAPMEAYGSAVGAALGYLVNAHPHVSIACTNPSHSTPVTGVVVARGGRGATNTCTITVHAFLPSLSNQAWFIQVNASALGAGGATFDYRYR